MQQLIHLLEIKEQMLMKHFVKGVYHWDWTDTNSRVAEPGRPRGPRPPTFKFRILLKWA